MDKYTKFILTVIAVALIGNLFDKDIITDANAGGYGVLQIIGFVEEYCKVASNGLDIKCNF